jgi:hypothetical protein
VPMIAEPTVAEVASRLAAPDVPVVLDELHVLVISTEQVCNLQFGVDSGQNGVSRSHSSADLAVRRSVEFNKSVKRTLELHWILGRGFLAYQPHNLIWAHVSWVKCDLLRLRCFDSANSRDFTESWNHHRRSNNSVCRRTCGTHPADVMC